MTEPWVPAGRGDGEGGGHRGKEGVREAGGGGVVRAGVELALLLVPRGGRDADVCSQPQSNLRKEQ